MRKKAIALIILVVIVLAVPLTLLFLRQSQDTRSRASTEQITFTFTPAESIQTINSEFSVDLVMDTKNIPIEALDVTITFDKDQLELLSATQPEEASIQSVLNEGPNNTTGQYRFVGVGKDNASVSGSSITITTLNFKAKDEGTAAVGFAEAAEVATTDSTSSLDSTFTAGSYTILSADACTVTTDKPEGCTCSLPTECESGVCTDTKCASSNSETATATGKITITSNGISYDKVTISLCKLDDQDDNDSSCTNESSTTVFNSQTPSTSNQEFDYSLTGTKNTKYRVSPNVTKSDMTVPHTYPGGVNNTVTLPTSLNFPISLDEEATIPTSTPTPTPTVAVIPTATLYPTPTVNESDKKVNFSVSLPGIGTDENTTPIHPQRKAIIQLFNSEKEKVKEIEHPLTIGTDYQYKGIVGFGTDVTDGAYLAKVRLPNSLTKQSSNILNIGTISAVFNEKLVLGDLDGDNELSIIDYNALVDCIQNNTCPTSTEGQKLADLNDDGTVDAKDLNLLYFGFNARKGD